MPPLEAIYHACLMRFRPIMMTTMAALFGGIPLAFGKASAGTPSTAWHLHYRRADRLGDADALQHAGCLPDVRPDSWWLRKPKSGAELEELEAREAFTS